MQPKLKSKVSCSDKEVGELTRVVIDPLDREISHLVIKTFGGEIILPVEGNLSSCTDEHVQLSISSEALSGMPSFQRDDYIKIEEVEIPHLERDLDVQPGEALVLLPPIEKDMGRRTFLTGFTAAMGGLIGLFFSYPIFKYIIHPMYLPFDNSWVRMGSIGRLRKLDSPRLIRYPKKVKEGFLEREFFKSHWALKASPEMLEKIYQGKDREFRGKDGEVIWVNRKEVEVVVFSGKCPHLGCAYRWRKHKRFGQAFICPCHLSVFAPSGEPLEGPSPRGLDILPTRVTGNGLIEIIDMEYKAGKEEQHRIV